MSGKVWAVGAVVVLALVGQCSTYVGGDDAEDAEPPDLATCGGWLDQKDMPWEEKRNLLSHDDHYSAFIEPTLDAEKYPLIEKRLVELEEVSLGGTWAVTEICQFGEGFNRDSTTISAAQRWEWYLEEGIRLGTLGRLADEREEVRSNPPAPNPNPSGSAEDSSLSEAAKTACDLAYIGIADGGDRQAEIRAAADAVGMSYSDMLSAFAGGC